MNTWSHLACLQPALITPMQWGTQWIAVVNPKAGSFHAMDVASRVAEQVGPRMSLYETVKDDATRLREITEQIAAKRPTLKNPLGILAFGGDRTGNDALLGVLHYIFPRIADLWESSAENVVGRMLESGIQLGVIRQGGANDNGGVYGSPADKVPEIMKFMDDAWVTSLNMGVAFLDGAADPQIFCHTVGAGETIATVYEKTTEERGRRAKWHREILFLAHLFRLKQFQAAWTLSDGTGGVSPILETLVHAVPRADEIIGLPTRQPGLGSKIFSAKGFWKTMGVFRESLARGRSSRNGDPSQLLPDQMLTSLGLEFQPGLAVGEEIDFRFSDLDGNPFATAIQANGDYISRASRLLVRALPPFPRFMVREGSLMANLHGGVPQ